MPMRHVDLAITAAFVVPVEPAGVLHRCTVLVDAGRIVAVAPPERLDDIRSLCDTLICLQAPLEFMAVGQFYERFDEVTDEEVCELLRASLVHHVIP